MLRLWLLLFICTFPSDGGKRLPEDVYFHVSQEYLLPPLLRLIVFAGRQIVGDVEADLIKISIDGRKVSFLRYANFDAVAHPELTYSVKVFFPKPPTAFATMRIRRIRRSCIEKRRSSTSFTLITELARV